MRGDSMSKTTNYEISKKLAEIGFKAETSTSISMLETKDYSSYDLETLLDALPEKTEIIIHQLINKRGFYLDYGLRGDEIFVEIKNNESLADNAGRLLILLHEKNLIKF
jgi:hypothetical protein